MIFHNLDYCFHFRYMRNKPTIYTLDTPDDLESDNGSLVINEEDKKVQDDDQKNETDNRHTMVSFREDATGKSVFNSFIYLKLAFTCL